MVMKCLEQVAHWTRWLLQLTVTMVIVMSERGTR